MRKASLCYTPETADDSDADAADENALTSPAAPAASPETVLAASPKDETRSPSHAPVGEHDGPVVPTERPADETHSGEHDGPASPLSLLEASETSSSAARLSSAEQTGHTTSRGPYHRASHVFVATDDGREGWVARQALAPAAESVIVDLLEYKGQGTFTKANFILKDEAGFWDVSRWSG